MLLKNFTLGVDDHIVCCPACNGTYLHHERVEVYERTMEDSDDGLAVYVEGDIQVRTSMATNPSRRRDGVRFRMWCENCGAQPWLNLLQHKGQTLLAWEKGIGA